MRIVTLALALTLLVGCGAKRVDPAGRPADFEDLDYTKIFIPVEKGSTEICVEYQDTEDSFAEDCILANEFHAVMRAAGRSGT